MFEQFGHDPLGGVFVATGCARVQVGANGIGGAEVEVALLVLQELGADVFRSSSYLYRA